MKHVLRVHFPASAQSGPQPHPSDALHEGEPPLSRELGSTAGPTLV